MRPSDQVALAMRRWTFAEPSEGHTQKHWNLGTDSFSPRKLPLLPRQVELVPVKQP